MTATAMRVEIVDEATLDCLVPAWDDLYRRAADATPSMNPAWSLEGWRTIAEPRDRELFIATVRDGDRLIAVWPLSITGEDGYQIARWLGSETQEIRDVLVDALAESPQVAAVLMAALIRRRVDVVMAPYVPVSSAFVSLFESQAGFVTRRYWDAYWTRLANWPDFETYYQARPASLRSGQRNRWKRLTKLGEPNVWMPRTPVEADRLYDWLIEQKLAWIEREHRENYALDGHETRQFLRNVLIDGLGTKTSSLFALRVDERIVAGKYSFCSAHGYHSTLTAYDPSLETCSPGRLLTESFIRRCFADGVRGINWSIGEGHWKSLWADDIERLGVYALVVSRRGWKLVVPESRPIQREESQTTAPRSTGAGNAEAPKGRPVNSPGQSPGLRENKKPEPALKGRHRPGNSRSSRTSTESATSMATAVVRNGSGRDTQSRCAIALTSRSSIEVIDDDRGFDSIHEEWDRLWRKQRIPRAFLGFDWCRQGWECVAKARGRTLYVVIIRDGAEPIAIWPLSIALEDGCRVARWLGSEASETRDVLIDPQADETAIGSLLLSHLRSSDKIDIVLAPYVLETSNFARMFGAREEFVERRRLLDLHCPISDWPDWDHYLSSLSSRLRYEQRTLWRQLAERGPHEITVAKTPDEVEEFYKWLIENKAYWFKAKGIHPLSVIDGETVEFQWRMAIGALAAGRLYLAALRSNGQIIAAFLSFLDPELGRMRAWLTTYDLAHAELSPSRLLIEQSTRWCFDHGYKLLDWGPKTAYKHRWAKQQVPYGVYALTLNDNGRNYLAESIEAAQSG